MITTQLSFLGGPHSHSALFTLHWHRWHLNFHVRVDGDLLTELNISSSLEIKPEVHLVAIENLTALQSITA